VSGTPNESEDKWTLGIRLLKNQVPRASIRTTLTYRFHPRLTAGVEYNPRVGEIAPIANFLAVTETERRPALMFGTSSDRIGTPSGQSFYGIVSKNLRRQTRLPIAPYVGLAYGTFEDRLRPVGGLNIYLNEKFSAVITYNGVHVHPIFNFTYKRHVLSFIMVRGREPGMSYSVSF
jgi:hypothetical protein